MDLAVFGLALEQNLGALPLLARYSIQPLASILSVPRTRTHTRTRFRVRGGFAPTWPLLPA